VFYWWRWRRRGQRGSPDGLPLEWDEKQGTEVLVDADMGSSNELVPNQPYSENMVSSLPKHITSPQPPDIHGYDLAANAPEVYVAPPSLLQSDIDQEIQIVEEEEVRIRIRRETHQQVLRLQLEEERLRARKTELVMMRN